MSEFKILSERDLYEFVKNKLITNKKLRSNLFKDIEFAKNFWLLHNDELQNLYLYSNQCQGRKRGQHILNEICYRIIHGIDKPVICNDLSCNNLVGYHTFITGYHKYCSLSCTAKNSYNKEHYCVACGNSYIAVNTKSKYCGNECKKAGRKKPDNPYNKKRGILSTNTEILLLINTTKSCKICNTDFINDSEKKVDHCHKTGQVRGILCNKCNLGIGLLNDSVEIIESALNYLKNSGNSK